MATIKEVANKAGVSVGTVSNVLANLPTVNSTLRKRVEKAIAQLQYRPNQVARSLKKQTTNTLGLVISDIANPFFPAIVRGAEDEAAASGYMLSIFNTDDQGAKEARALDLLDGRRVDGVLLVPSLEGGTTEAVLRLLAGGTPVVTIDREIEDRAIQSYALDAVVVDNRLGMAMGVEHLVAGGARRVAYLGGPKHMYIARERLAGFERGLREQKLKKESSLLWTGDFRPETGYSVFLEKYPQTKPDALFCGNMLMCMGVLRAVEEMRLKIPQTLQIVTFDSFPILDAFRPRVSAVAQPTYEIGRAAVRTMVERLKGRAAPSRRIVLNPEWKPGETTFA
ncbi:MAG: LacI family DNA-binding transcriptional regulator [Bryobacter sp.]